MDINDAIENYSQYVLVEKALSRMTLQSYQDDLKQFFIHYPDKKDTDDLLGTDVLDFFRYELSLGLSVSTCLRRLSSIKGFYNFLNKEGIIHEEIPEMESIKRPNHLPTCLFACRKIKEQSPSQETRGFACLQFLLVRRYRRMRCKTVICKMLS